MSTHNICLYKEVDKKYTACNLKVTKSLDCALIGICAVIRFNTVSTKTYVVSTHYKGLGKVLLMSTHNMFLSRNKKNIMWIPPFICSFVHIRTQNIYIKL